MAELGILTRNKNFVSSQTRTNKVKRREYIHDVLVGINQESFKELFLHIEQILPYFIYNRNKKMRFVDVVTHSCIIH